MLQGIAQHTSAKRKMLRATRIEFLYGAVASHNMCLQRVLTLIWIRHLHVQEDCATWLHSDRLEVCRTWLRTLWRHLPRFLLTCSWCTAPGREEARELRRFTLARPASCLRSDECTETPPPVLQLSLCSCCCCWSRPDCALCWHWSCSSWPSKACCCFVIARSCCSSFSSSFSRSWLSCCCATTCSRCCCSNCSYCSFIASPCSSSFWSCILTCADRTLFSSCSSLEASAAYSQIAHQCHQTITTQLGDLQLNVRDIEELTADISQLYGWVCDSETYTSAPWYVLIHNDCNFSLHHGDDLVNRYSQHASNPMVRGHQPINWPKSSETPL